MIVGPGTNNPDEKALKQLFSRYDGPVAVDADAIDTAVRQKVSNAVLTPHQEEAQIIRQEHGSISEFIGRTENTVVLVKGSTDKIYSDEGVVEVDAGDPTMTVGGTGDLLAGVVGSLISQGLNLSEAAELGAKLNAEAGKLAARELGNGATAKDILSRLPKAQNNI
ncbi:MAG: putative sugar kinase [Candidatus Nanosalina sp. J07AB43]|nr:MAG: putative sugar kinase [Candidatus Nanosalina sp. J07AB43]